MKYKKKFLGRDLEIETEKFALQATGSALVKYGETAVLGTVVLGKEERDIDFLPLVVDYEEKYYARGKIGGSRFVRREGRPSDEAILSARMIDRCLRPLFPKNLKRDIQIILTVLSFDEENDPDFPALLAAYCAILNGGLPFNGPIGGIRICLSDKGDLILNPSTEETKESKLNLFVCGKEDKKGEIIFPMVEGEAKEIGEKKIISAFKNSQKKIKELFEFLKEIQKKEKKEVLKIEKIKEKEIEKCFKKLSSKVEKIFLLHKKGKEGKEKCWEELQKLKEKEKIPSEILEEVLRKTLAAMILKKKIRPDGRKPDEMREIECRAHLFERTHGSGFFRRGFTQTLSILTLGSPGEALIIEGMEIVGKKRFMHHYNFPPYCAGEIKRLGWPSRREIGHGALVEKALLPLFPPKEEFPYTIRVVSEVLSSNGSTSMASCSSSSLALFDGGVPMKSAVTGVSIGLVVEDEKKPISQTKYETLVDIQGPEDSFGSMDFKIAGTKNGVTAMQLDTKIEGISFEIIEKVLSQAKKTRQRILQKMEKILPTPRKSLSEYAPRVYSSKVPPEKIRLVIGPQGKTINKIIEKTGATIDFEENGTVFVTASNERSAKEALLWIKDLTREIKVGETFEGEIKRILDTGVIVEILPRREAMLPGSEVKKNLKKKRVNLYHLFKPLQKIKVKVKSINGEGRIFLTLIKK